ncbi:MAG TPA: PepSY-associated TM helix domain-containing protein [Ideonella sp.]|nr:PepSY-associated TM helix domain-containing protein [Ideonella sp.]
MFQSFRHAATWVHTWFGLVLGFVLMVCFFFGAVSVFDREIDRWAIPASRFAPQPMPSFDKVLRPVFEGMQPNKESLDQARTLVDGPLPAHWDSPKSWEAFTTHRDPVLNMSARWKTPNARVPDDVVGYRTIDPRSGKAFADDQLKIGSQFFFPLHYNLTLNQSITANGRDLGVWIVGVAGLVMLVALISGVIMHRKVFREFFTFRPRKSTQRSVLDLHNMTGVLALPFHFFFALTGLLISAGTYFPVTDTQLEPLHELHEKFEERETGLPHDRAGVAAPLASVDAMVVEAQRRWAAKGMAGEVGSLRLTHVGDANGYVSIFRAGTDRIASVSEGIHFKASTGQALREDPPQTAVGGLADFLVGLHLQHFRHWLLRWFYVLGGLMGAACIATGFIFFVEKRKQQHAKVGGQGSRVVDALAVTTVTGMLVATMSILNVNRLLPAAPPSGWPSSDSLQIGVFWTGWALAMLHAFARSAPVALGKINPAWREQCWAVAVMAVAAVLLNGITTGGHLLRTISTGYWPVAGVDLSLLATAVLAIFAARKLRQRETGQNETGADRPPTRAVVREAANV